MDGTPVSEGSVQARSVDTSSPFDQTVSFTAGTFTLTGVPRGVTLEVTASRAGWTRRRRVIVTPGRGEPERLDFGSPDVALFTPEVAFFLSPYLEVVETVPGPEGTLADPSRLTYEMLLDKPLDPANQLRFERALRILPADTSARGGTGAGASSLATREASSYPFNLDVGGLGPYHLAVGDTYRKLGAIRARLSWDTTGTKATLTFGAPLIATRNGASFQVLFMAGDKPIADADGRPLGTGPDGRLGSVGAPGSLILSAFQARRMAIDEIPGLVTGTREARWASTHDNTAVFKLPADEAPPRPVEVAIETEGSDTVIAMTFDAPLVAFDGSDNGYRRGPLAEGAASLAPFTFVLGMRRGDTVATDLDGRIETGERVIDPRSQATFGKEAERKLEFRFDAGAYVTSRTDAAPGSLLLDTDPTDPRRLRLVILGRKDFFDLGAREIRLRVERLEDPAGNPIGASLADRQTIAGEI